MIISHRWKFIFVKTYKTAGTSIEAFLSGLCGPDDVATPIAPPVEGHVVRNPEGFHNHMPAHEIRERVGASAWRDYRTFCVERNPWDRFVSWYFMTKNSPLHGGDPSLTIDEYLDRGPISMNWPIYMDPAGEGILVDRVIRYETLERDLGTILGELGIPFDGTLKVRAKSDWRSDRRHYREILTARQAERIGGMFAKEIALHGYGF